MAFINNVYVARKISNINNYIFFILKEMNVLLEPYVAYVSLSVLELLPFGPPLFLLSKIFQFVGIASKI